MQDKNRKNIEDIIRKSALGIARNADRVFNRINSINLSSLTNLQMVQICYEAGKWVGFLEEGRKIYGQIPDYEKAISRLEIMRNKLYQEAKRKDRGF